MPTFGSHEQLQFCSACKQAEEYCERCDEYYCLNEECDLFDSTHIN